MTNVYRIPVSTVGGQQMCGALMAVDPWSILALAEPSQ